MWWAKIGLMLGHDHARYEHPELNRKAVRFDSPPPDYTWMVDNSPAPVSLSVFVHHSSMEAGQEGDILGLPSGVRMADGATHNSHLLQIVTPDLSVAVVSHPGMTIGHPLVQRGEAWELLRGSPGTGDLASLPKYDHHRVIFRQGLYANEGFHVDSSAVSRLLSLVVHDMEDVPEAYPAAAAVPRAVRPTRNTRPMRWLDRFLRRKP